MEPITIQFIKSKVVELLLRESSTNSDPTYHFELSLSRIPDEESIIIHIKAILSYQNTEIAHIKTENIFKALRLNDILAENGGCLPRQLLSICISISFSTMRGIFAQIMANTELNSIMFPIINPDQWVQGVLEQTEKHPLD